jgi:hypothetical protein
MKVLPFDEIVGADPAILFESAAEARQYLGSLAQAPAD